MTPTPKPVAVWISELDAEFIQVKDLSCKEYTLIPIPLADYTDMLRQMAEDFYNAPNRDVFDFFADKYGITKTDLTSIGPAGTEGES